ncbi:MAG: hypothetical protein RRY65_06925 [Pseudoflavonifractor sp.]
MSDQSQQQPHQHLQHDAEHAKPRKRVSVFGYLAILFAAAFLLLLLSYFMQQRTNEETINGLKSSVSAMQSVENLVEQNKLLQAENDRLTAQADRLEEDLKTSNAQNSALLTSMTDDAKQLTAMDWFWRIQRAYSRGSKRNAKELVDQFEASLLPAYLPKVDLTGQEGPSPAEQYLSLLSALDYQPTEP